MKCGVTWWDVFTCIHHIGAIFDYLHCSVLWLCLLRDLAMITITLTTLTMPRPHFLYMLCWAIAEFGHLVNSGPAFARRWTYSWPLVAIYCPLLTLITVAHGVCPSAPMSRLVVRPPGGAAVYQPPHGHATAHHPAHARVDHVDLPREPLRCRSNPRCMDALSNRPVDPPPHLLLLLRHL